MRIRPRLDDWSLTFTLTCIEDQVDAEALKMILDYAGRAVGIGDYRPRFGGFAVTQFRDRVIEAMCGEVRLGLVRHGIQQHSLFVCLGI